MENLYELYYRCYKWCVTQYLQPILDLRTIQYFYLVSKLPSLVMSCSIVPIIVLQSTHYHSLSVSDWQLSSRNTRFSIRTITNKLLYLVTQDNTLLYLVTLLSDLILRQIQSRYHLSHLLHFYWSPLILSIMSLSNQHQNIEVITDTDPNINLIKLIKIKI